MSQVDLFLRRMWSACGFSYLEDIFELYNFVPNGDLKALFAAYHTALNCWFSVMNDDIRYEYDDEGNRVSNGGYFHAEDSRRYLSVVDGLDQLRSKLKSTQYEFKISGANYDIAIKHARKFVAKAAVVTY